MLSSNVKSIDLLMACTVWQFWVTRHSNGCSTPAPRSSAAKQLIKTSDSVTRVNDSTRVTLRKKVTRLDSSHVFHRMARLESQSMTRDLSQSHFYKFSEFLIDKPTSCALEKWAFFASVVIKIGANFQFCLSNCSMLHFKDQTPQLAQRLTWDFSFTEGSARHNISTLYRGLMQYLNIVILAVGLILWLVFFRYQ